MKEIRCRYCDLYTLNVKDACRKCGREVENKERPTDSTKKVYRVT